MLTQEPVCLKVSVGWGGKEKREEKAERVCSNHELKF